MCQLRCLREGVGRSWPSFMETAGSGSGLGSIPMALMSQPCRPDETSCDSQSTPNGDSLGLLVCATEKTALKRRCGLSKVTPRLVPDQNQLSGLALVDICADC